MNRSLLSNLCAGLAGVVFGAGLLLGGMTDPRKVLGFLDVFGNWDPQLLFVMGGAVAVHAPLGWLTRRRERPWLAERFALPTLRSIDPRLVVGAALFGVGWGLSGYCPGPALVSLPSGGAGVLVFVGALVAGMWSSARLSQARQASQPAAAAR